MSAGSGEVLDAAELVGEHATTADVMRVAITIVERAS